MKNLGLMFLVTFAMVCAGGVASAQMGMRGGPPAMSGLWHIVVGSGSLYEMQREDGTKHTMEFDVIGKESAGGKDAVWLEMVMNNGADVNRPTMVFKELVTFDTSTMQMELLKVIMQRPGAPPMDMSAMMTGAREPIKFTDVQSSYQDVGSESVTTPAGTFSCERYKAKDGSGEAWVSDKVVPFGLVKSQGKTSTMTLVKMVTDAKDKITGTPQPFDPMKMIPQQQPQPQPQP
jgi:hypothetical protein